MADTDLIARAAGGDAAAFQALVERHRSMVYRVAYQFAGNHYDAEDIAQEVFIKVYRSLDKFRQDAQLSSWMYRIVMNACIDHRRRHHPSAAAPFGEEAEHRLMNTAEDTPGPEDRAYAGELGEIATALGLAEGTVKRQLHAAVHRLRAALSHAKVTAGGRA